ncbi:hypothetical protein CBA19CS11_29395 [Caballeronia novacaledonica]|uniref:hypothetical protein n=1 Tax=Caballeronia novacaledonica TaxID=1544861 RepID=UPI001EE19AC2|nr:hypothetical protein [Caballeronia novacaledonica]GJH13039.1 hypothetical protein CBA19CS11_29395 [Caballeronia novacaledonica]
MACCVSNHPGPGLIAGDSRKRVNYTLGMLLGVDDFVQESVYDGSRRRELARELLGYGTVHGLGIVIEADGDKGPRLRVASGMAWLPSGTPVCVDSDQCANLNDWLAAHQRDVQAALAAHFASPPRIRLYVVLSYVACLTDNVPIPGEPCRSEDELMQPSRIADGFRLELRLAPPQQREEDALRDFVEWLVSLPLAPAARPLDEASFVAQLREAARAWLDPGSPPVSPPDYMTGAAPAGTSEALFRAALRFWATELRPLWMARADCGCSADPIAAEDDAVLLAELDIDVVATLATGGWRVADHDSAIVIDESRRPVLLSLRMVQELILRQPQQQRDADRGDTVVAETSFGQLPDPGASLAYARADHTHGSPELPALGGDLSGPIGEARIENLQGVPVSATSPLVDGNVLTFEDGRWVPRAIDLPVPPPAQRGQFVGRFMPEPYEIVAAGEVMVQPGANGVSLVMKPDPGYGVLKASGAKVSDDSRSVSVSFTAAASDAAKLPHYIVKLTPVWTDGMKFGFQPYLFGDVNEGGDGIFFKVRLQAAETIERDLTLRFQVEVSRF